jgi:predicted ATPase/DNA-binding SARP family transcriptional activator
MPGDAQIPFVMRLFGSFHVMCEGKPLRPLRSQKVRWLLALLALRQGREVQRTWLADMLWRETDNPLSNLNTSLYDLRKALGTSAIRLVATPRTLCLNLSGADVDVIAFDADIRQATPAALQQAVSLYTGPLLEDCPEPWVVQEREQRATAYAAALETLATYALTDGNRTDAIEYLRKAVVIELVREKPHHQLMELLAETGDYVGAMNVYTDFARQLHEEAGRVPEEATVALYQHIRQRAHRRATATRQVAAAPVAPSPSNIPYPLTPLLGRDQDLQAILARLSSMRLVTLTGTGGVGKTRLATEAALEIAATFAHGAHMVRLDSLSDPALIPQHVATVLGVEGQTRRNWTETLVEFLRGRQLLLVLDNCEHLIEAAADFARQLLLSCSGLRLLATSRERLGLTGEAVCNVPPLSVPTGELPADLWQCLDYSAIRLFCDRAVAVRSDFSLSEHNAAAIGSICRHLDGLPLAIELAAALLDTLTVQQIEEHLTDRFRLLQRGDRTVPKRHQALKATLDWSYDQLTASEQTLLARLSVFAGGWTLSAAEALYSTQAMDRLDMISLLSRLVSKSLIMAKADGAVMRYGMLETIREYGLELLAANPALLSQMREFHAEYYTMVAETAAPELSGPNQTTWLAQLEQEIDNLRAALSWAIGTGHTAEMALRLGGALWRFWFVRGYLEEGQSWLQRILQLPGEQPTALRIKAAHGLGNLYYGQFQNENARSCFNEALMLARTLQNRRVEASEIGSLANIEVREQNYAEARRLFTECLELFEAMEDKFGTALSLSNLAMVACQGEKDYVTARDLHLRGLALFRELGSHYNIALECINLAYTLIQSNDTANAYACLNESLNLSLTLQNPAIMAHCLTNYSGLAMVERRWERAAVLIGADFALRERIKYPLPDSALIEYQQDELKLRNELGDTAYETYLQYGRSMTEEEIRAYAVASMG